MAAAQRGVVQGRITDGTLFPNISAKVIDDLTALIRNSFDELLEKLNDVLELIRLDLKVVLAADGAQSRLQDRERQERKQLAEEVKRLKTSHEQMLESFKYLD